MSRVGLIGVGAMGRALLARLHAVGHRVRATDVAATARQAAAADGAEVVATAAEAARGAAFVHVFVRTDEETMAAVQGETGVLAGAAPGTLLVLHGTILPETTRAIAAAAAAQGVHAIDAPVTSVPAKVKAGQGVFLVGAPDEIAPQALAHLKPLGGDARHFGRLGSGNVAKLVKNFVNGAERVVLAEALMLAEAGGLDARQVLDMMKAMDAGSLVGQWEKAFELGDGKLTMKGGANIFDKDMPLAAKLAAACEIDLPVMREAAAEGLRLTADRKKP